jgi:Flp pilus assembly protein TadG
MSRWHDTARGDEGSIVIGVVVLVLALLVAVGLVYDGGHKLNALAEAQDVASNAARAGGQQISDSIRVDGQPNLDAATATARASQYLASTGHQGSVRIAGDTITVTVTVTVPSVFLPGPLTAAATEHATAVGTPRP